MKKPLTLRLLLLLNFSCFFLFQAQATHLRGGYMTYHVDEQNSFKYHFSLIVYADELGVSMDNLAHIHVSDGSVINAPRKSITVEGNQVIKVVFEGEHTFSQERTYTVFWAGINRNPGIINIKPTSDVPLVIQSTLDVSATATNRYSLHYLVPSSAQAYVGQPFKFNFLAFDQEGDSLSYELITPYTASPTGIIAPVAEFVQPDDFRVNRFGEITWDNPALKGQYNFALQVTEHRNGKVIGTSINEFQILVFDALPLPQLTLLNKEGFISSSDNLLLAPPGQKLRLQFHIKTPSNGVAQKATHVSELLEPHLRNLSTLQVSTRDTTDGFIYIIDFVPSEHLRRNQPYAIGVNSSTDSNQPGLHTTRWEYAYLYVGEQLPPEPVEPKPEPEPEETEYNTFALYPNPASHYLVIEIPTLEGASEVFFFASNGQLACRLQLEPGQNIIERQIELAAGLYTYQILSGENKVRKGKLVLL
ncbi:T9SS type A sorting domain-containing protein [Pontibacter sp. 13R65]|uniref:T9SS type A sorting domain-containing protein n=1 Tax=Pontibacter sp. 13R65 TaxID=3127458 RepID=UPI00301D1833